MLPFPLSLSTEFCGAAEKSESNQASSKSPPASSKGLKDAIVRHYFLFFSFLLFFLFFSFLFLFLFSYLYVTLVFCFFKSRKDLPSILIDYLCRKYLCVVHITASFHDARKRGLFGRAPRPSNSILTTAKCSCILVAACAGNIMTRGMLAAAQLQISSSVHRPSTLTTFSMYAERIAWWLSFSTYANPLLLRRDFKSVKHLPFEGLRGSSHTPWQPLFLELRSTSSSAQSATFASQAHASDGPDGLFLFQMGSLRSSPLL